MRAHGLPNEADLLAYTLSRVARTLASRQRVPVGWDEIIQREGDAGHLPPPPPPPPGTVVQAWRVCVCVCVCVFMYE